MIMDESRESNNLSGEWSRPLVESAVTESVKSAESPKKEQKQPIRTGEFSRPIDFFRPSCYT